MKKLLGVNRDLMIRTFCLLAMTNLFVARGVPSATTFLRPTPFYSRSSTLWPTSLTAWQMPAAFLPETAWTQGPWRVQADKGYHRYLHRLLIVAATLILLVFQGPIIRCFTNLEAVITLCDTYMVWLVIFPATVGIGLVYYGFYTGVTHTTPVRNSMLISLAVFVAAYSTMVPLLQNHGLWLSFLLFSLCRSLVLFAGMKEMERQLFFSGKMVLGIGRGDLSGS